MYSVDGVLSFVNIAYLNYTGAHSLSKLYAYSLVKLYCVYKFNKRIFHAKLQGKSRAKHTFY